MERLPKPENTSALGWPPLEEEELEGDVGPRLMAGRVGIGDKAKCSLVRRAKNCILKRDNVC